VELINIIPKFFEGNGSYETSVIHQLRSITFDKQDTLLIMNIEVQPEERATVDVYLAIIKADGENFASLLACVWAVMERELSYTTGTKVRSQAGNYTVYYLGGKLEVLFQSVADRTAGIAYTVKFQEFVEVKG